MRCVLRAKMGLRLGLRPEPCWGSLQRSPRLRSCIWEQKGVGQGRRRERKEEGRGKEEEGKKGKEKGCATWRKVASWLLGGTDAPAHCWKTRKLMLHQSTTMIGLNSVHTDHVAVGDFLCSFRTLKMFVNNNRTRLLLVEMLLKFGS